MAAPAVEPETGTTGGTSPPSEVISIESFEVHNFGAMEQLRLDLRAPAEPRGQWTLLVGDNGRGKTSLLRAMALACSGFERWGPISLLEGPPHRQPQRPFRLAVSLSNGATAALQVDPFQAGRLRTFNTHASGPAIPLWAYGCTRGSALGGPRREVETDAPDGAISTLFRSDARLIHAESWLLDLERRALRDRGGDEEVLFDTVRTAVASLLPGVTRIEPGDDGMWVHLEGVRVPMATLSDGYSTTAGWLLDMLARWVHLLRRAGHPPGGDLLASMRGVVFIDEIDLHLHPRWQRHMVSDLRRIFPALSFVATTHNPLTLLGAQPGEVFVLEQEEGRVVAHQRDLPPGVRADQVLTGPWFGLTSTLDDETLTLLERHRRLLRAGARRDDPGRLALEADLRARLGTFAELSEERLAQEVAARHLPEHPASAAEREQARLAIARLLGEQR